MKEQIHQSIQELNNIAYVTFDTNTPEQRQAFNQAIDVLQKLVKQLEDF
jgi:hypothetical protein